MSAQFFFRKSNWKLWSIACVAAGLAASLSIISVKSDTISAESMNSQAQQAWRLGHYRPARRLADMALLRARLSNDKSKLIDALMTSAQIDSEFEEFALAESLAKEAAELSSTVDAKNSVRAARTRMMLADMSNDTDAAIKLYKEAMAIFKKHACDDEVAHALVELSVCYDSKADIAAAISAAKAAVGRLEADKPIKVEYAKAVVQYAKLADLDEKEKLQMLKDALNVQEKALGPMHPELSPTLMEMAATETDQQKKEGLLARVSEINGKAFGHDSLQIARNLSSPPERSIKTSVDLLDSYSKLLHSLKMDKEAERSSDPEYWQRSEIVPIAAVKNFASDFCDHIQVWYQKGELKLEAYREGEKVFQDTFAECPTGIVNISAEHNSILVSWRDGNGPIWHNDQYIISNQKVTLLSSTISDAYAQQIKEQLNGVLSGDPDAINDGSVEAVPGSYINNNLLCDAIRQGENKALQLYGEGDVSAAADRLATVFDFTVKAINSQRNEVNHQHSRQESWIDAWQFQGLPLADYISALNDYGFFLQQNGCLKESAKVLSLVTNLSPQRAIAHLNLADSFWRLGQEDNAKKSYQTYITLMKESRDIQQIPSRVKQRLAPVAARPERRRLAGFELQLGRSAGGSPASNCS